MCNQAGTPAVVTEEITVDEQLIYETSVLIEARLDL